mmetsp:Transcript_2922/g.5173  ORF Transcript_2922/g.5173 Transcript_2922/m.5173 type:complete len:83 (-) Transcript_2922:326-574(-)
MCMYFALTLELTQCGMPLQCWSAPALLKLTLDATMQAGPQPAPTLGGIAAYVAQLIPMVLVVADCGMAEPAQRGRPGHRCRR